MAAFECMKQDAYRTACEQVDELVEILFVVDADDSSFLEHVNKMRHIHWPLSWGKRIAELHERYVR